MKELSSAILATLAAGALAANAATVVTSYGTVTGADDANQAGPMWGMSLTPNIGAAPAGTYTTLYLEDISFQLTSSVTGKPAPGTLVYAQIYDGFATNGSGTITSIGSLVGASTDQSDLGGLSNSTVTWNFLNQLALDASSNYMVLFSTEQNTAATLGDTSNLVTAAFELNTGNPYSGGQAFRANGGNTDWDMEFRATFDTEAIPEPSSALLGALGFGLVAFRRKRA